MCLIPMAILLSETTAAVDFIAWSQPKPAGHFHVDERASLYWPSCSRWAIPIRSLNIVPERLRPGRLRQLRLDATLFEPIGYPGYRLHAGVGLPGSACRTRSVPPSVFAPPLCSQPRGRRLVALRCVTARALPVALMRISSLPLGKPFVFQGWPPRPSSTGQ